MSASPSLHGPEIRGGDTPSSHPAARRASAQTLHRL